MGKNTTIVLKLLVDNSKHWALLIRNNFQHALLLTKVSCGKFVQLNGGFDTHLPGIDLNLQNFTSVSQKHCGTFSECIFKALCAKIILNIPFHQIYTMCTPQPHIYIHWWVFVPVYVFSISYWDIVHMYFCPQPMAPLQLQTRAAHIHTYLYYFIQLPWYFT